MAMAEKKQYARNDLLAEPEWVEEHLHDSDVRLIDCRLEDAYRQGHIPQAVRIPVPREPADPTPLWLKAHRAPTTSLHAGLVVSSIRVAKRAMFSCF
jgi:3-mercaptopyruvate sulfurtransferase SseA